MQEYEYERKGTCNNLFGFFLFGFFEPLQN